MSNQQMTYSLAELRNGTGFPKDARFAELTAMLDHRERITAARQRLAELLDADTYDCATLHTAARDLLNALEG